MCMLLLTIGKTRRYMCMYMCFKLYYIVVYVYLNIKVKAAHLETERHLLIRY